MKKGVVLVSGGMDSLVTTAIAKQECDELFLLHINYGQLTEKRELLSFQKIVEFYQPQKTLICELGYLKEIGNSSLTDKSIIMDRGKQDGIPNTYVPFRNANLLAIATSWAEAEKCDFIYIGAVEEDSSGYPDCRELFFTAFQEAINYGTKHRVEIKIPLLHLSKKNIILLGDSLSVDYSLSWSCYENNETACGNCPSCVLRLKAFELAGIKDPIKYL